MRREIFKKRKINISFDTSYFLDFIKENQKTRLFKSQNLSIEIFHSYSKFLSNIEDLLILQKTNNISSLSVLLLSRSMRVSRFFSRFSEQLSDFLSHLDTLSTTTFSNFVFNFVGKWYDFPSEIVTKITELIKRTKNNEYEVNFYLDYDFFDEIANISKLISRMVSDDKIVISDISKSTIIEVAYLSFKDGINYYVNATGFSRISGFNLVNNIHSRMIKTKTHFYRLNKNELNNLFKQIVHDLE